MRFVWKVVLGLSLACAASVQADTVFLNSGLKLEGKIWRETPEFIVLLVYQEAGRVRIPRDQIKSIEYDLASRLEDLAEDDWKGHYELGVWAFEKGMYVEAIGQFEKVKGKEGAGTDTCKRLGQAYDKREQSDKAYEAFKEYLLVAPEDQEIAARVKELEKVLGLEKPVAVNDPAKVAPKQDTGLEATWNWKQDSWKDYNACVVSVQHDNATGNKTIAVQTEAGNKDKFAVSGTGKSPLDLSTHKEIVFKVFHNNNRPLLMAVAFKNKANEFYESMQQRVPPNAWTTVTIPIGEKKFKSTRNNFEGYTDNLGGADHIREVEFLVYEQSKFLLYLDFIYFLEGKAEEKKKD